ncbi:MAG TPA: carbamoyltransferase N-terminal domain-containing protein, partial [Vicinamibacterales bacterium]|nr:carbamoyltransferase N-terminal domain-containing protein [Vicinamibacterales bacterium]
MKVLGMSPLDKDSTVSLMEDGRMLYAAAEERFTRVKLQDGFPWRALDDALQRTGTTIDEIDCVTYPFLPWEEETRLFQRNLSNEREFLEDAPNTRTAELLREAASRVPARTGSIPGLREPNERMDKGLAKTIAYRLLASDSVISRNVAKRGSEEWGRTATAFHKQWHDELESSLVELGLGAKLKRVDHHLSHAANAYYTSGFSDALIVTLDGYGSGL